MTDPHTGEKDRAMPTYTLCYEDDGKGVASHMQFEATDASGALRVAQSKKPGRRAILWDGERPLCRIQRQAIGDDIDIWVVAPVDEAVPPPSPARLRADT